MLRDPSQFSAVENVIRRLKSLGINSDFAAGSLAIALVMAVALAASVMIGS